MIARACVRVAVLALAVLTAEATTYYVSPTGNDSNAGTSWEKAFDVAGSPRVSGRGVDIGCYERSTPGGLNIIVR